MIAREIVALELSPIALIVMLLVFYAILGCVLEGMSSIVMTLPITLPLVQAAGFDKIWFGVFLVVVVEMAQITPPVGFNLFVIQGMTGERIGRIALATPAVLPHHGGARAAHHVLSRGGDLPSEHHPARRQLSAPRAEASRGGTNVPRGYSLGLVPMA